MFFIVSSSVFCFWGYSASTRSAGSMTANHMSKYVAGGPIPAPLFFVLLETIVLRNTAELRHLVENLALPLAEAQGLCLWGIEITSGPVLKVCIYVDQRNGELGDGSASIDQCEAISRPLGLALDVEDCIDQAWVLEVSSPGFERRFFTLEQMKPYIGDIIDARLKEPLPGSDRKTWRGKLVAISDGKFELEPCSVSADGEILAEKTPHALIPWQQTARVRREHIFVTPPKPGKKSTKKQVRQLTDI